MSGLSLFLAGIAAWLVLQVLFIYAGFVPAFDSSALLVATL